MKKSTAESCLGALLVVMMLPVMLVVGYALKGFVLSTLWGWFMVPLFGLPSLGLIPAIGVAMVVSFLTFHYVREPAVPEDKKWESAIASFGFAVLYPLFTLFIGWIAHLFM